MRHRHPQLLIALTLVAVAAILLQAGDALTQNSLGIGRPEQAIKPEGPLASLLLWIQQQQQAFYRSMTGELQAMRSDGAHVWALAGLSFAYGIFHAAGPGHGKAVISSYMIANEVAARRGIWLAFASALAQALTAIILISLLVLALRGSGLKQGDLTRWLEIASYAAVTLLGAWLLWSKIFRRGHHHHQGDGHHHEHDHGNQHEQGHDGHGYHEHGRHNHAAAHPAAAHSAHSDNHHEHERGTDCGHLHAPDPAALEGRFSLRQAWSAILAVGLRPCSGAIIVLTFAFLNGLYLAGIASTLAMAMGTGITVAVLAALAVWAKDIAVRIGGATDRGALVHRVIEIGGALLVFLLGLTLLSASLY